ncbi:hypothetical protein [Nocardioides sp. 1609]|uniref:hypothetical protein n=1 Tax=Nocardioides sp. 1609 TaxID=2508327 RepID=UPI00106FA028|nr:hypothetical protein [Nocardioides sp. 1609]
MKTNVRTTVGALSIAAAALAHHPHPAAAAPPTTTRVTIAAEGTDLFGTVSSGRGACERNRTVHLYKQVGTRGGSDDVRVAQDTTEVVDGVGRWSTGNTGMSGRFYARATRTASCGPGVSPTIRVSRD